MGRCELARRSCLRLPSTLKISVKVFHRRGAPPIRAVDGLTFAVTRGSIFGLLGPNGAGKTTTLRILTTLARPTEGRAAVAGFDVVKAPLEVRRRIAVVIQEQAADLLLTVLDNLVSYARFHGMSGAEGRRRAAAVLEQFGLVEQSSRKVQDLSGGFRRRVQVAKVFMVDTPVVFLDEFSTGMDPILKRAIMTSLREEARQRTNDHPDHSGPDRSRGPLRRHPDHQPGRQVARGDLQALKLLSGGVYEITMTFEEVPPGLEAELSLLHPLRLSVTRTTLQMALKEPERRVLALVSDLASRGRVLRVEVGGASLEDVFVELTTKPPETSDDPLTRSCSAKPGFARPTCCSSSGMSSIRSAICSCSAWASTTDAIHGGAAAADYNAFFLAGVLGMASFGIASNTAVVVLPRSRQRHLL